MSTFVQNKYLKAERGYIALMSALILSALLMIVSVAANSDAFIARANLSHTEDHVQAKHQASACGSIALRILNLDSDRLASTTLLHIQLDENTACTIVSGTVSGNDAESVVRAQVNYALSLIYIHATRASSTAPFVPTYWSELTPE